MVINYDSEEKHVAIITFEWESQSTIRDVVVVMGFFVRKMKIIPCMEVKIYEEPLEKCILHLLK
jgi:hypothetical protein